MQAPRILRLYSFRYALNGFSARLTSDQVSRLKQSGAVARVWLDTEQRVQTNNSAIFLGLEDQSGGLRADLDLRGEDVIIADDRQRHRAQPPGAQRYGGSDPERLYLDGMVRGILAGRVSLQLGQEESADKALMYEAPQGFTGVCQVRRGLH